MLALTSCTDYIDIDAENTIDVDAIDYTDASTMHEAATGAYATLRTQGIHWANAMIWMGRDDDMSSGRADDQGDALKFGYPGGYTNPNAFWAVGNMWSTMYNIIIDCNSNIDALDQYAENLSTGSSDYQNYLQYKGEVRVVRAWAYYQLVTNFGPCVIYRDNTQNSFRRSTVEKVYDYIITEMQEAAAGMEAKRPNQMSRPGAFTKQVHSRGSCCPHSTACRQLSTGGEPYRRHRQWWRLRALSRLLQPLQDPRQALQREPDGGAVLGLRHCQRRLCRR